jgi:aminoglycoside phosphotransferase (APT) family kinase protein
LEAAPLTPIHNDPSPTNILFAEGRFVFLDWDEVTLSDPLRDIGLLLWWNFPPSQWPAFFEKYGLSLEAARLAKIYWFAARASLDIALWHAEHSLDGRSFAADFLAALDQQPNPQGY